MSVKAGDYLISLDGKTCFPYRGLRKADQYGIAAYTADNVAVGAAAQLYQAGDYGARVKTGDGIDGFLSLTGKNLPPDLDLRDYTIGGYVQSYDTQYTQNSWNEGYTDAATALLSSNLDILSAGTPSAAMWGHRSPNSGLYRINISVSGIGYQIPEIYRAYIEAGLYEIYLEGILNVTISFDQPWLASVPLIDMPSSFRQYQTDTPLTVSDLYGTSLYSVSSDSSFSGTIDCDFNDDMTMNISAEMGIINSPDIPTTYNGYSSTATYGTFGLSNIVMRLKDQ